jgi:hypothetical protein
MFLVKRLVRKLFFLSDNLKMYWIYYVEPIIIDNRIKKLLRLFRLIDYHFSSNSQHYLRIWPCISWLTDMTLYPMICRYDPVSHDLQIWPCIPRQTEPEAAYRRHQRCRWLGGNRWGDTSPVWVRRRIISTPYHRRHLRCTETLTVVCYKYWSSIMIRCGWLTDSINTTYAHQLFYIYITTYNCRIFYALWYEFPLVNCAYFILG